MSFFLKKTRKSRKHRWEIGKMWKSPEKAFFPSSFVGGGDVSGGRDFWRLRRLVGGMSCYPYYAVHSTHNSNSEIFVHREGIKFVLIKCINN